MQRLLLQFCQSDGECKWATVLRAAAVHAGELEGATGFDYFDRRHVGYAAGVGFGSGGQKGQRVDPLPGGIPAVDIMPLTDAHHQNGWCHHFCGISGGFQAAMWSLERHHIPLDNTVVLGGIRVHQHRRLPGDPRYGVGDFAQPRSIGPSAVEVANRGGDHEDGFGGRRRRCFLQRGRQAGRFLLQVATGGQRGEKASFLQGLHPLLFGLDAPAGCQPCDHVTLVVLFHLVVAEGGFQDDVAQMRGICQAAHGRLHGGSNRLPAAVFVPAFKRQTRRQNQVGHLRCLINKVAEADNKGLSCAQALFDPACRRQRECRIDVVQD